MPDIDRATVEHVATLSRLALSAAERSLFEEQLRRIIGYFAKLNELNTDDVEPLSHPLGLRNVFRGDEVTPSMPRDQALGNAPAKTDDAYKVPVVVAPS